MSHALQLLIASFDFIDFVSVAAGLQFHGLKQTLSVEPMHTGEYVELLIKQRLHAFLAFVAAIDLDATVLDCSEFTLELLSIGRVALHLLLESLDLLAIALEGLAYLVLEILDLDLFIEVGKQILNLHNLRLLREVDDFVDVASLLE